MPSPLGWPSARAHLFFILNIVFLALQLQIAYAGQGFTNGLAIIDAPSVGNPGHAGSDINIALDVSGDGQLPTDAVNANSSSSTHFSSLEIYLVSSSTGLNLTVSDSPDFLTQEQGTVRHLNWPIPKCIIPGQYNLTFYEYAIIDGQPHYTITPILIPVSNDSPTGNCSSTTGVTVNSILPQPQSSSPLPQPLFPGNPGNQLGSSSVGFTTITLSGTLTLPTIPTVTITPSATPTTVIVVSLTTLTTTVSGSTGVVTSTVTETAWTSTAVIPNNSGLLPVNSGTVINMMRCMFVIPMTVVIGLWTVK